MISKSQTLILVLVSMFLASLFVVSFSLGQTDSPTPTPSPAPAPTMLWQFTPHNYVGSGNYSVGGWSTPTIVDGVVYVDMYGSRSYEKVVPHEWIPGANQTMNVYESWGGVYAINATTGKLVWFVTTQGSRLSPAVGDGKVFAQISEGKMGAFNISNGQSLWTFTSKAGTSEDSDLSGAVATVSDGAVFVGGNDWKVYALNAADGSTLWAFAADASSRSIDSTRYSAPTVVDGIVYVGSNEGAIYALNAASGDKLWSRDTNTSIPMVPIVVDGVVVYYSSYDPYLHALNAENGNEIWNFTTGTILSVPVASNHVVYVNSGLWEKGDTIVRDKVYALNSTNGAILWNSTLGGFGFGSPTVVNGVVYVGSLDHNLYALNANTGQMIWKYTSGTAIFSTPAVVNNVVYFSSDDGALYALKTPALASSPSTTPTVPEFSLLMILPLILSLIFIVVLFRKRKLSGCYD